MGVSHFGLTLVDRFAHASDGHRAPVLGAPAGGSVRPSPRKRPLPERGGRVKGGEAAEPCDAAWQMRLAPCPAAE
jgi:hypothetical protein